ncbi:DUF1080 domain-containing protein [Verrucomicrobiaceae bacterium 5K15]|uniref:DUF1080 domain-containing protein n=1 Tax=Oceaniferula flava TaxID=2800421 RepID=A0AAE2SDD0_9BACT|nr:DUF1080 domain-containing protein [Oceaniferula flavus]MBK1856171.1 DUF1080 domain-containing protein [Oceaniferula flavus]MBM1137478.1 DUF1080 domain-containing protein [Oceaniferula flavus]
MISTPSRFLTLGLAGLVLTGSVSAEPAKKKVVTPKQPWSDYRVHDTERPHPEKVKTAGAITTPAPADAIVLFDGKNTEAFTKNWKVEDGVMIASPGKNLTKQSFGSIQMHVEWRIPAGRKVQGQGGGNSGIFMMDRYEVQVMESHTNVTYADGQAGALYGQTPPLVNASAPQGEWQSYDIIFEAPVYGEDGMKTPAYITVIHNGVVVQQHQKYYGPTVFRKVASYPKTHPEKAPIQFQWHGDPIEYRNIWVRELKK